MGVLKKRYPSLIYNRAKICIPGKRSRADPVRGLSVNIGIADKKCE